MPNDTAAVAAEPTSKSPLPQPTPTGQAPEFPGCHTIPLKREDLLDYDGRFEYWDADTETAWVVSEPTSATHEQTSQRLAGLGQIIAGVRGSPIECYGTMDLLLCNERGEKWRIMQADQSVYLHPGRVRLPVDAMEIGEHHHPDVVLEVDHTTDVRRGKLGLYEAWGFPEVWVDTPESGVRGEATRGTDARTDDLPAGRGRLPDGGGEPGVSGLDGGEDPPGAERGGAVTGDEPGAAPGRPGAGAARGHGSVRHAVAAHGAP